MLSKAKQKINLLDFLTKTLGGIFYIIPFNHLGNFSR